MKLGLIAISWVLVLACLALLSGCLGHRLTAAEVVGHTQAALDRSGACHSILDLDIDTDLLKDSISLQVWEQEPGYRKIKVLSAENVQLRGMAFATDGGQSVLYTPDANQVLVGPADQVKMPQVIERLVRARTDWIREANPDQASIVARAREGGLVTYQVQFPIGEGGSVSYTVDARQWWVRHVSYEDKYLGKGRMLVRKMACGPALAASHFDVAFPDGVPIKEVLEGDDRSLTIEQAQTAVAFPLRTPAYLPPGMRLSVVYRADKNVVIVYEGEGSFALVQGPHVESVSPEVATPVHLRGRQAKMTIDAENDSTRLTWAEDGLEFSIAGSLEQQELIRIAESLEPAFQGTERGLGADSVPSQGP